MERQRALERSGALPAPEMPITVAPTNATLPYHMQKRIKLDGTSAVCDGDTVVVELTDIRTGEFRGKQFIKPDGSKKFTPQLRKDGTGAYIGTETDTIYVTEGWADAVIVHRATGMQVLFALDASNLPKNVAILRDMERNVIVAADNDEIGIKAA